jgi:DNA gyrase/topoisomerase IV subunit B
VVRLTNALGIMTDQDHDGSHIKGLIINFLDHFWPSLLKIPNFLLEFITPIVKVTRKKKTESFFTIPGINDAILCLFRVSDLACGEQ